MVSYVVSKLLLIAVSAIIIVGIFEFLLFWLRKIITIKSDKSSARRVTNVFRIIFYTFLIILELGVWGVDLVALLAGAGFLGIIIGLAVQVPLGNFFSGVYMIISRIVKRGDEISINAIGSNILITGTVRHMGFGHTEIVDAKGKLNIVPNTVLVSSILVRVNSKEKIRIDVS